MLSDPLNLCNSVMSMRSSAESNSSGVADNHPWLYALRDFASATIMLYGLSWTFIEVNSYFNPEWQALKQLSTIGHYIFLLHAAVGGLLYAAIMDYRRHLRLQKETASLRIQLEMSQVRVKKLATQIEELSQHANLPNALVDAVSQAYERRDYVEVIRLGQALSRPLWLSGEYRTRIAIGTMVEESAALSGRRDEQAMTLIDDLGWTYVVVQEYDLAIRNIKHGIELAAEAGDIYLATKGIRHLGNISIIQRNNQAAMNYLLEAKEMAANEPDITRKQDMTAGIHYALAELHIAQRNYEQALVESSHARNFYQPAWRFRAASEDLFTNCSYICINERTREG